MKRNIKSDFVIKSQGDIMDITIPDASEMLTAKDKFMSAGINDRLYFCKIDLSNTQVHMMHAGFIPNYEVACSDKNVINRYNNYARLCEGIDPLPNDYIVPRFVSEEGVEL